MATQQLGYNQPIGSQGNISIVDSQGNYTYYFDLTTAMRNAKSGDVIILLKNLTEYLSRTLVLKDGVTLNLNGFTYTNSNASLTYAFTDYSGAVALGDNTTFSGGINFKILNGTFVTSCVTNFILCGSSTVITTNATFTSATSAYLIKINNSVTWIGGSLYCTNSQYGNCIAFNTSAGGANGAVYNVYISSAYVGIGVTAGSGVGTIYNSIIYGSTAGVAGSTMYNCIVTGNSVGFGGANSVQSTYNCIVISTGGIAIGMNMSGGGTVSPQYNLTAISTVNLAGVSAGGTYYNLYAYSTAASVFGFGAAFNSSNYTYASFIGGTLTSTVAAVLGSNVLYYCYLYGTTIDCQWNNVAGHGVWCHGGYSRQIINCYIKVANSKANCLYSPTVNTNVYYINNTFVNSLKPVTDSIIQAQTNLPDLYDNIALG